MSRSYKKNPIHGISATETEKNDKKRWHRTFRRNVKNKIHVSHYDLDQLEDTIFPAIKEESNKRLMSKDGKKYWRPKNVSLYLIEYFKKIMRK
jgi:hypothetical protein